MRLPIGIAEIGIADGIAAVQHHPVSYIDAAMRDSGDIFAHRALKEHDVSGLHLVIRHGAAQAVQSLGAQPAGVADAAGCEHIRDKAGAVEAGFRACAAPDIRIADVLDRFLHQRSE